MKTSVSDLSPNAINEKCLTAAVIDRFRNDRRRELLFGKADRAAFYTYGCPNRWRYSAELKNASIN